MKKLPFTIKPYRDEKRPNLRFVVRGKDANQKWVRKFFATDGEAKTFAHLKNTQAVQYGAEAAGFPTWLRVMAQQSQDRVAPFQKTIADAVDFYVAHLQQHARSCTIERLLEDYRNYKRISGVTKNCIQNACRYARLLEAAFPGKLISDFTTRDINQFLSSRPEMMARTINTQKSYLSGVFSFAKSNGYCSSNPVVDAMRVKVVDDPVGIVEPDELARLLSSAHASALPAMAIQAFAGVRLAEVLRLDWKNVDLEAGLIEITAKNSKTAQRRLITILPALRTWLEPFAKSAGRIAPLKRVLAEQRVAAMKRAGIAVWPANALRHSYCSYHLAHFKDAGALAIEMGHVGTKMIYRHYREVVRPEKAAAYWEIKLGRHPLTLNAYARTEAGSRDIRVSIFEPSLLQVFAATEERVKSITELATYFGVSRQAIYKWSKRPTAPQRINGEFDVAKWRDFARRETQIERIKPLATPKFFVARSAGATNETRRYFQTLEAAEAHCQRRNKKKTVGSDPAENLVAFSPAPSPLAIKSAKLA